jgi:hypothetical protein
VRGLLAVEPHGPLDLRQIIRPTFKIVTDPLGKGAATRTGFGDTELFDLFVMPWPNSVETGFRWGIGPCFVFPTASWHGAGDGAWQLGPAFAFGYRAIPHLVISALFQQASSLAYTSSSRKPVSSLTIQPMITYEFARDWYAGSNQSTWKINPAQHFHHHAVERHDRKNLETPKRRCHQYFAVGRMDGLSAVRPSGGAVRPDFIEAISSGLPTASVYSRRRGGPGPQYMTT